MFPSVMLINPKYPHNVGGAIRACAAFGAPRMYWTGRRVSIEKSSNQRSWTGRLPREERMRAYKNSVAWAHWPELNLAEHRTLFDIGGIPVAIEIHPGAEPLSTFEHPESAVYIFGPEDGSINGGIRRLCHRFVVIPTAHCLNLAAAINVVLYDRRVKRQMKGLEPLAMDLILDEQRGHCWEDDD